MITLLQTYKENEARNEHTENAALLAKEFGNEQEQDEAARHQMFLRRVGYQSRDGVAFQGRMSVKYFHLLEA